MDNFKLIYKILRYLEKAMDYDEPYMDFISAKALRISEQRWTAIIEMLAENGYIKGIEIKISADGTGTAANGASSGSMCFSPLLEHCLDMWRKLSGLDDVKAQSCFRVVP